MAAAGECRVRVAVRVRPFLPRESGQKQICWVRSDNTVTLRLLTTQLKDQPKDKPRAEDKSFSFDHCFSSVRNVDDRLSNSEPVKRKSSQGDLVAPTTQVEVYETIGVTLLDNALNGFNCCLFAYGQTGSGKTHTVLGSEKDPGIIPRLTDGLFSRGGSLRVSCSFLEIYNEQLKDLLDPELKRRRPLYVHQHPQLGVYVPHLTEAPVCSHAECMNLLDFGSKIRATYQTNMNSTSSRSHALFIVRLAQQIGDETNAQANLKIRSSTLNLIDLAGSERVKKSGAAGQRMREGQNINSSLSVLGQVISKLADESGSKKGKVVHVPFRQSKLTYLLTDALSGNSQTLMVAAISPAQSESEETLGTLRFASSVKKVKTIAVRNEQDIDQSDMFLQTMRSEIDDLRTAAAKADPQSPKARRLRLDADAYEHMLQSETLRRSNDATVWGNARAELEKRRRAALSHLSLPFGIGAVLDSQGNLNASSPYLLNISDDISLAGKLLFFLPEEGGSPCIVGSDESNQIRLMGLGITERLCQLSRVGPINVNIRRLSDGGRLLVNGCSVPYEESRALHPGDRIIFGRAFAFRLVVPGAPSMSPSPGPDAIEDSGAGIRDVLNETVGKEPGFNLGGRLQRGVGDEEKNRFVQRLSELQNDVDEANDLVRELVPAEETYTQDIGLLSAVKDYNVPDAPAPELVVQQWRGRTENGEGGSLVAVWPLSEFHRRLEVLRDLYQQQVDQRRGDLPEEPDGLPVAWDSPTAAGQGDPVPESAPVSSRRDEDSEGGYIMPDVNGGNRPSTVPVWHIGPPVGAGVAGNDPSADPDRFESGSYSPSTPEGP